MMMKMMVMMMRMMVNEDDEGGSGNDDDMAAGQLGSGKAVGARQQVAAHDDIIGTVTQPDGQ